MLCFISHFLHLLFFVFTLPVRRLRPCHPLITWPPRSPTHLLLIRSSSSAGLSSLQQVYPHFSLNAARFFHDTFLPKHSSPLSCFPGSVYDLCLFLDFCMPAFTPLDLYTSSSFDRWPCCKFHLFCQWFKPVSPNALCFESLEPLLCFCSHFNDWLCHYEGYSATKKK